LRTKAAGGGILFHFYPRLDRAKFSKEHLRDVLLTLYNKDEMSDKVIKYNEHWKLYRNQVEDAFSDAFQRDVSGMFNDITGNITFNPICPRYLERKSFDVFYLNSERGALGVSLHELIHFVWFDVWGKHFSDSADEYETPHLKWIFSEMAVDPIMRKDSRLSGINPYFDEGCAYGYFYSMIIDGKPILETLYEMYSNSTITEFMEQGYEYCKKYEPEIRKQMN
jgi:hypothetical protein